MKSIPATAIVLATLALLTGAASATVMKSLTLEDIEGYAREVFVGTLGTIFGIEGADENMVPLVEHIQSSGLAIGSGLALLVFFAIALQCVSTVAILARESESNSLVIKMFVGYFIFAYAAAVAVYHLAGLFS